MADPTPTSAATEAIPQAAIDTPAHTPAKATAEALKKGSLVRLNPVAYRGSLEASASDAELPGYVLEGPGEILAVKGEHAQIRWRRPVPDVWLRLDQLEAWRA
jgi:hypothetical protein